MKLVTPATDLATGKHDYWVWEYDETRPRNLEADDPRQRYAVSGLVGTWDNRFDAEQAALA